MDQLRRTAIPCYCPHCIRDIRPGHQGNPQKRTDQLLKRKQNIRLVNIKIPKPPSCRNRNTVAPFHAILPSQFLRVRLLRNIQPPCFPVSLVIVPRVPLELARRLDWNETSEILTELITPLLLSHGKNIISMHHKVHRYFPPSTKRKTQDSAKHCTNPKARRHFFRNAYHCLDACLKP